MRPQGIQYLTKPQLDKPVLIAGFGGWGNVLNVSTGLVDFLIEQFNAEKFAVFDHDLFFRYDETRPVIKIVSGTVKAFTMAESTLYAIKTPPSKSDIIVLKSEEPQLAWRLYTRSLFNLLNTFGVEQVVTIGSMYDQVLHTDRVVSGAASSDQLLADFVLKGIRPIAYHGPSAIHSILQAEGPADGFICSSLWCHCPFYLQGTVHYGYIAHMANLLADLHTFDIDVASMDQNWRKLEAQIDRQVAKNPEVQAMIQKLGGAQPPQTDSRLKPTASGQKVIDLQDFLPFKTPDSD